MSKLTIVIPSRNERFLPNTILDLLEKAHGDIEIIAVLDGYWPDPPIPENPNVILLHKGKSQGMRSGINSGVAIATGEYIMKLDGHCMLDEGFDVKILQNIEDNWVVIPRRKRLDAEKWCLQDVGKPDIDASYLSYPDNPNDWGGAGLNGRIWTNRIRKRIDVPIDDELSFQGSCWVMKKTYFHELELMDEHNYGPFWNEAQEIGFKCWLSGGRVVRNKTTWYAHLHKGKKYGRGYFLPKNWATKGNRFTMSWFGGRGWHKQDRPLSWLIEKFMPMPDWDQAKLDDLREREKRGYEST